MPPRKPRQLEEKPQREWRIEKARESGASEDPEEFELAFKRVVPTKQDPKEERGRRSLELP
jgi:hypothetical protein